MAHFPCTNANGSAGLRVKYDCRRTIRCFDRSRASEAKARAASRAIADMEGNFAAIRNDISRLDQKIRSDISRLDQKIDQKISEFRSDVDRKISDLRSYVDQRFTQVDG